jgi:hypothetical protein
MSSNPEICHAAPAAVPAANLGPGTRPSRLQPPTGDTDGIESGV